MWLAGRTGRVAGRETAVVSCPTWSTKAAHGAEGEKNGEIHEMWRRHKLETHGRSEIEVSQVHVSE